MASSEARPSCFDFRPQLLLFILPWLTLKNGSFKPLISFSFPIIVGHEQAAVHRSRSSGRSHQAPGGWAPILLLAVVAVRMAGDDPATALIASLIGHVGAVRRKFPR